MSTSGDHTDFTADDVMRSQKAVRDTLGLKEETFSLHDFIGMMSDEIDQLRGTGRTDGEIARMLEQATGHAIDAEALAGNYASREDRRKT